MAPSVQPGVLLLASAEPKARECVHKGAPELLFFELVESHSSLLFFFILPSNPRTRHFPQETAFCPFSLETFI